MNLPVSEVITRQSEPEDINLGRGEVILIDKPTGKTSFDVIRYLKKNLPEKKYGHAGTLDPLATGLLIICSGKATKKINLFQKQDKEYEGTFRLGAETPSYDSESEPLNEWPITDITPEKLREATKAFTGEITQIPPAYSAVKVKGERAYNLARKGISPELKSRQVMVHSFEILKVDLPDVTFRIKCSTGTYIRSIVHDLGKALNNGAYLTALRRTMSGKYSVNNAMTPEEAVEKIHPLVKQ